MAETFVEPPDDAPEDSVASWSSRSKDGKLLKTLIEQNIVTPTMSPMDVKTDFPTFEKYAADTFSGGLSRTRKAAKDAHIRQRGEEVLEAKTCE